MNELHLAARRGDLAEIQRLLDAGTPVDLHDDEGHTALMAACLSDDAGPEVLRFLIDRGADVNALTGAPSTGAAASLDVLQDQYPDLMEDLDPEIREMLEKSREMVAGFRAIEESCGPERSSVLAVAAKKASLAKLRLLLDRGADPAFRSAHGYTLAFHAAAAGRMDVVELLLTAGADPDGESNYGESALKELSRRCDFAGVGQLLAAGADPAPLGWSPLHRAVALGSREETMALLDAGADPEARDSWGRTAFLLAIEAGDIAQAELLLSRGADRDAIGRCGMCAAHYPLDRDDADTLRWLIGQGFAVDLPDEFGNTPLIEAASAGAAACFDLLLEAGADWRRTGHCRERPIRKTSHPAIIRRLVDLGEDPALLEDEALRNWIGLGNRDELPVAAADFHRDRTRRFGTANPERMDVPFWRAMVRCGWPAYQAARQFDAVDYDHDAPVWSHHRFGMSLTALPDGRFVQIAGEHEDHYDPDFCIYNDVIVHDGKGGFEIFGYPEEIFPPTDFHSATLVGEWIYLIGNLGYPETREAFGDETPVFRLRIDTWKIERVATRGTSPGWIHKHQAKFEDGCIRVFQGKVLTFEGDGESKTTGLRGSFSLNLATSTWTRR